MKELEKHYNGLETEKEIQKYWKNNKIYDYKPDKTRPLYSIDTPPPTVSGSLHIGHIFSYTQAEMIARYRRMQGFNVFYPFGFDDNGLPSERLVEKETGIKARDIPRSEFCNKCVEITQKYEEEFIELWKSMGFSCDWNLQYSTVSENTQRLSQKSFLELVQAGHAYIKESPVLWCVECQTSIAQAELENIEDAETNFNYIPFVIPDGEVLIVATTRPEYLYGCVCLFVNPEDDRYAAYIGKNAVVPLYNYEVPVMADEKVGIDKGTGVVMCCTFGDSTDAEWYEKYKLPYRKILLPYGVIADDVPYISGMKISAARKEIIKLLDENGLLKKTEKITHTVASHERCGKEVEIIPSRQWYIEVLNKKEKLLKAGNEVKWYPAHMKNRYDSWVENLKWDWCISRQRYFGIPIPVWYCENCGKPAFAKIEQLPINPIETDYLGVCECGSCTFSPDKAVFDTWATSSITPLLNLDKACEFGITKEEFMPMSMRTQAHEIIRTWAFYTIVKSLYHTGEIPWKEAMICGFVLAKPGEKISKSKSNSKFSPQELINEYSADSLRYYAATARIGTDMYFDIQEMQDSSKRLITKLWNSSKFVLSHLDDFDPKYIPVKIMPVDKWIIEKTNETIIEASKWLNEYEIGMARKIVDDLFWKDLCDNYIEIVKERLYQPENHGFEERKSAQYAIYYCLFCILKMYAIYIPHETEYIYLNGFKDFETAVSIHLTEWEKPVSIDSDILKFGEILKQAVSDVRKFKTENNLSMRAEVEEAVITAETKFKNWLGETEKDFIACCHAKKIKYNFI